MSLARLTINAVSSLAPLVFAFGTAGCGPTAAAPPEEHATEVTPRAAVIRPEALTTTFKPGPDLQRVIRAVAEGDKHTTLRLTFVGITPPSTRIMVRVYLNADPERPLPGTDAPQFVSSFSFYGPAGEQGEEDVTLSLNAAVARLQRSGLLAVDKPVKITAIAVPLKPQDDIDEVKIPFKRLRLSAIRNP